MTSQIKSRADEERVKETGRSIADEAGARVADVAGAVRTTVNEASDRLPDAIDTVRTGAMDGARTIQEMPDPTQRLLAAFSLGLGLGLSVAGAPRLVVVATLAPALLVAATILNSGESGKHAKA